MRVWPRVTIYTAQTAHTAYCEKANVNTDKSSSRNQSVCTTRQPEYRPAVIYVWFAYNIARCFVNARRRCRCDICDLMPRRISTDKLWSNTISGALTRRLRTMYRVVSFNFDKKNIDLDVFTIRPACTTKTCARENSSTAKPYRAKEGIRRPGMLLNLIVFLYAGTYRLLNVITLSE